MSNHIPQFYLDIITFLYPNPDVVYIDGLMQDCSNSIANALVLLQSYAKPSIFMFALEYE